MGWLVTSSDHGSTRREFVGGAGRLASLAALTACAPPRSVSATTVPASQSPAGPWDLSWIDMLGAATDRAVFDWPSLGDPSDSIVLQIAARYLDNCAAAYKPHTYKAIAVMNIRTTAIPAAMTDAAWSRYSLGAEYNVKDPATQQPAVRNLFWSRQGLPPAAGMLTLDELAQRGNIFLVCDFAMGHLSTRLATKVGRSADDVHADLRRSLVPGAFAVPSGIFGLARAQNAGCAFVRM
ncbi:MAG TPA: hypothetical protein VFJ20_14310 [Gemmatimonadaceae bacterium]|nr:hypothetical protein [Gemmatimonadaceae bacterium]